MGDKYYHVAVWALRPQGMGIKSAHIKVSPGEDVDVGVKLFAHIYFPDDDGWHDHAWDYGRIADDIIALERSAAHDPLYTPLEVKARVLEL